MTFGNQYNSRYMRHPFFLFQNPGQDPSRATHTLSNRPWRRSTLNFFCFDTVRIKKKERKRKDVVGGYMNDTTHGVGRKRFPAWILEFAADLLICTAKAAETPPPCQHFIFHSSWALMMVAPTFCVQRYRGTMQRYKYRLLAWGSCHKSTFNVGNYISCRVASEWEG